MLCGFPQEYTTSHLKRLLDQSIKQFKPVFKNYSYQIIKRKKEVYGPEGQEWLIQPIQEYIFYYDDEIKRESEEPKKERKLLTKKMTEDQKGAISYNNTETFLRRIYKDGISEEDYQKERINISNNERLTAYQKSDLIRQLQLIKIATAEKTKTEATDEKTGAEIYTEDKKPEFKKKAPVYFDAIPEDEYREIMEAAKSDETNTEEE